MITKKPFRRVGDVVQRDVAGETLLVPIRGNLAQLQELFALNEVGRWLWERLDEECGLEDLVGGLTVEFDIDAEQARRDIQVFLDDLAEAGLMEEHPPMES
ncbi:MAG: PqqD family protein [Actinobacteria bacterium]|jgi:hypothetical protein|nr:PqqD family protein [Actinomycetota bacterium]